jgi:hypothetical protein
MLPINESWQAWTFVYNSIYYTKIIEMGGVTKQINVEGS